MSNNKNTVHIVGHKNPDTDSICTAIAYAQLKNTLAPENTYVACRAGTVSSETEYVLSYFGVEAPPLLESVGTQVGDMHIETPASAAPSDSILSVWQRMQDERLNTLPITTGGKLAGLISVNDIARSNMGALDNSTLGNAHTPYTNLAIALQGEILTGKTDAELCGGKTLIGAAEPEILAEYVDKGDLVILGNRTQSQLCAIENGAACLVVCTGAAVEETVLNAAKKAGCVVILTPFDSYIATRLISQAAPISYFMKKDGLITFSPEDSTDDAREIMTTYRHRDFPVVDGEEYLGTVSRQSFLGVQKKQVILVDHNEKGQAVDGVDGAEIIEIVDHHRLGDIETLGPLFFRAQPLGCTATIVNQMYEEAGLTPPATTAGLLCAAILSDTLFFRSPTCTAEDKCAATKLAEIAQINMETFAQNMFRAGSNLSEKTEGEIFTTDYKRFESNGYSFGVGQISSMSAQELGSVKERMLEYMKGNLRTYDVDFLFFMLTDILNETSLLLFCGSESTALITAAFGAGGENNEISLPGVMSRKKQLIPSIMQALQDF